MDANKVIQTMSIRFADKLAALEKEVAFLMVKNNELKVENEELKKEGLEDDKGNN